MESADTQRNKHDTRKYENQIKFYNERDCKTKNFKYKVFFHST